MEEKLAKVHDLLGAIDHQVAATNHTDPAIISAVCTLTRATVWLLDAVEQMYDERRMEGSSTPGPGTGAMS